MFAREHSASFESSTSIRYNLSCTNITLSRVSAPNELIAEERENAKDATKVVYGVYTADIRIIFIYQTETGAEIESDASFIQRMIANGENINETTSTAMEMGASCSSDPSLSRKSPSL